MAKATVYITERRRVEIEVPDRPKGDDSEWIAEVLDKAQVADEGISVDVVETYVYYRGEQVY